MVMEYKNGLTVQSMKEIGWRIKLKVKEHSGMPRVTYTLANSRLTKHVVLEFTHMLMEVVMKVNGLMMFNKVKVKKLGLMEQNM